jgi:hypothetical protein
LEIAINDTLFNQMTAQLHRQTEKPTANSGFKKLAVQWLNKARFFNQTFMLVDSFMQGGSSVLHINICAEKPAHRKSAKH